MGGFILNEIFYHIHKINNKDEVWKVENELEIGKDNNKFFEESMNFESKILMDNKKYPFKNVYEHYLSTKNIQGELKLLDDANNFINEFQILIRELGMEEIRRNLFPQIPSRQKCIWLCRKEQINYWKNRISGKIDIFKVEIFDEPFKTRESFIPLPSDSYNEILRKSKEYWQGVDNTLNEDDEYLYVGKLKIIDKFEETNN